MCPEEWLDSILCEEFDCLPSQLETESPRLLLRIRDLRGYEKAFRAVEAYAQQKDSDPDQAPRGHMVDLVYEILKMRL